MKKEGTSAGDGIEVLAATPELMVEAIRKKDYNDASYVLLYRTGTRRILFSGDAHDKTWKHVLEAHLNAVANVDVLIAPHHGRDSDRAYGFLKVVKPKLTLFG